MLSSRVLVRLGATVLTVSLVAGCAASGTPQGTGAKGSGSPSASVTVDAKPKAVPAITLPGVTYQQVTTSSMGLQFFARWPVIPKADKLNELVTTMVDERVKEFQQETPNPKRPPELNLDASPVVANGPIVGVRVKEFFNPGASSVNLAQTYYGSVKDAWATGSVDLFSPDGQRQAAEAVVKAASEDDPDPAADRPTPKQLLGDVLVTRSGDLEVLVPPGLVGPNAAGESRVPLSKSQTQGWLSDEGKQVVDAVVSGAKHAAADATPSPTATATQATPRTNKVDCARAKCVALTYDDGPASKTPGLLNLLAQEKVAATFFPLGVNVKANTQTLKLMDRLGFEIGSHTWAHRDLKRLPPAQVRKEVQDTAAAIKSVIGRDPFAVRPPYGSFNDVVRRQGVPLIMWDVDTEDWKNKSARVTAQRAIQGAKPGSIILMHDIHASTITAAPQIIKGLRAKGFTFVTVSQLIGDLQPGKAYFDRTRVR